jgi:putrescine transport system substrate-binding protein
VRKFHSSEYLNALATGEICFVVGFSGDVKQAQKRAAEAKAASSSVMRSRRRARNCGSTISPFRRTRPTGRGARTDQLSAQAGGRGEEHQLRVLRQRRPAEPFIDKSILDDRTIYPDAATMAKLYTITAHDQKTQRLINRLWTKIKTGQ